MYLLEVTFEKIRRAPPSQVEMLQPSLVFSFLSREWGRGLIERGGGLVTKPDRQREGDLIRAWDLIERGSLIEFLR